MVQQKRTIGICTLLEGHDVQVAFSHPTSVFISETPS